MRIKYPAYGGTPTEIELTHDALIERSGRGVIVVRLAEVQWIQFYVGTERNHDWHDSITFGGPGVQRIGIGSTEADPAGIRESRALYRKFVRLALKRMHEAGAQPRIAQGGVAPQVATALMTLALFAAIVTLVLFVQVGLDPGLLFCLAPTGCLWFFAILAWRNPPRMLSIIEARDIAVPEKGAE